jgi:hypothetical protein
MRPIKPIYAQFMPKGTKLFNLDPNNTNVMDSIYKALRGRISYGTPGQQDNVQGVLITVADTGLADTNFTVTHNLLSVPQGFQIMKQSIAGSVYTGSVAWTTTTISLKCSTAHAALTVFVFY